jgi:hypothetical protein
VIFVGILQSQENSKLFYLFVIKSKKHVLCYQVKENDGEFEGKHDEFVEIISTDDQFNKEDVYLIQQGSETETETEAEASVIVIVKKKIRVQGNSSSQTSINRVTIKEIQEKIEKINRSRNINEKNTKEDNKVKIVDQIPI